MLLSRVLITPDWPAPPSVRALTTTRRGGVSGGAFARFNLATHVGDDPACVARNRARLRRHARLPAEPCWLEQTHGTEVIDCTALHSGRMADACVARVPDCVCAVLTADCLPVLLCARDGSAVAVAHAGWRGLAAGILERTVQHLAIAPAALLAWLGPAIGPQAYVVGAEVRSIFCRADERATAAFQPAPAGRWFADLYLLARQRLAALGITQISGGERCTFREADWFFSYRRDGRTGRMATLIWLTRDIRS